MKNRIMALIEVIGPVYQEEIGLLLYSDAKRQTVSKPWKGRRQRKR